MTFERHGLTVLPAKVGRLAVHDATPSQRLILQATIDEVDEAGVRGDVLVVNSQGEPVLSMATTSMAKLGQPTKQAEMPATALSLFEA